VDDIIDAPNHRKNAPTSVENYGWYILDCRLWPVSGEKPCITCESVRTSSRLECPTQRSTSDYVYLHSDTLYTSPYLLCAYAHHTAVSPTRTEHPTCHMPHNHPFRYICGPLFPFCLSDSQGMHYTNPREQLSNPLTSCAARARRSHTPHARQLATNSIVHDYKQGTWWPLATRSSYKS
jgi:hypothetical protein